MTPFQALTLAVLVLQDQIEIASGEKDREWASECREAVTVLRGMVRSIQPGSESVSYSIHKVPAPAPILFEAEY